MPVPFEVLRLGPDDPRALAWLWANWGTRSLRQVAAAPLGRAERAALAGRRHVPVPLLGSGSDSLAGDLDAPTALAGA